ncbi:hypothetical protein GL982_04935 [Spiroplasma citri]|uniref:hypothetical protein n=1 Tax=Spiroplasma citri TaxID=2133 RepID=UPI0013A09409|nr:hypothetical protein [Spiroplasma citri]QIA71007.1 hypothetical protein GL981_06355 [Spiroplasma citri]QIA73008.1 hypothetical protein GL982_04935 [Spiroplasma citri]
MEEKVEKESKTEFETEFEKIVAEIKSFFEYKPKSEEQIKKENEFFKEIFWEKYNKHVNDEKCQFTGARGLCYRKAKKGYECIVCNSPCCYICYKNYYNCKECLFYFSDDDSDFKYYLKIYFNENYYKQD